ncbi:MAG: O-antigen ligase family protein [Culicoidibacterales bacterium]
MQKYKKIDNFIPYIPAIYLILNFVPGFLFKIIFISLLVVAFGFKIAENKIKLNKVNIVMIIIMFYFAINLFFLKHYNLGESIFLMYNSLVLFFMFNLIKKGHLFKTSCILLVLNILFILFSLYEVCTGDYLFLVNDRFAKISEETGLYYPLLFFANINDLSYLLTLLVPFGIYAISQKTQNKYAWIYLYLGFSFLINYFTYSIIGMIAMILYSLYVFAIYLQQKRIVIEFYRKRKNKIKGVLLLSMISLFVIGLPIVIGIVKDSSLSIRYELVLASIEIIKNNIFTGIDMNLMYIPPHNFFLNIGVALGLLGMIPFLFLYFNSIFDLIRYRKLSFLKLSTRNLFGFSLCLFFITNMIPSNAQNFAITWIFLGLSIVAISYCSNEV